MNMSSGFDIESAARKLAECMDYPWDHMPALGRDAMREHARAIISAAQPAIKAEPVAYVCKASHSKWLQYSPIVSDPWLPGEVELTPLYSSLPTAEVSLPERDNLRDAIAQAIGGATYDCTRVWAAWCVGTMTEDDFVPLADQEERLYEIADACLEEIRRLKP